MKQIEPLCVLDFYVHESCQRLGIGKILYEYMLEHQKVPPNKIGIDKPSEKLINFMRRHYNLARYQPQNNNFVIYDAYFDNSYKFERPADSKTLKARFCDSEDTNPSKPIEQPQEYKINEKTPQNYPTSNNKAPNNEPIPRQNQIDPYNQQYKIPPHNTNQNSNLKSNSGHTKDINDPAKQISSNSRPNNFYNTSYNSSNNNNGFYNNNPQELKGSKNNMNATASDQFTGYNKPNVSNKETKYMNDLDGQIKRTENDLDTIRKNMQKLQEENLQIREDVKQDMKNKGTHFSDDELKNYYKS